nr:curculin-like (mannose-binding) lectin family protein / PAN domain-containing protein [Tanacetum cinerariifolium]
MSFKNYLRVPGNRVMTFSARAADTPVVAGSPSINVAEPKVNENKDEGFLGIDELDIYLSLSVDRRLDGLSFDELANFDDVQALRLAMSETACQDVLKVGYVEGSFQVSEDSWKALEEEKESTFLSMEANLRDEVETLSTKLKSVHLERVSLLVKDFLPSNAKKLMASNHFSLLMADLEQKAMMFGSAKALNDVLGFGDSWKLEDIKDYESMTQRCSLKGIFGARLFKCLLKGGLVAKGVMAITLKCVRSQVQFLLNANNLEVATSTSCKGRALSDLSLCGGGFKLRGLVGKDQKPWLLTKKMMSKEPLPWARDGNGSGSRQVLVNLNPHPFRISTSVPTHYPLDTWIILSIDFSGFSAGIGYPQLIFYEQNGRYPD